MKKLLFGLNLILQRAVTLNKIKMLNINWLSVKCNVQPILIKNQSDYWPNYLVNLGWEFHLTNKISSLKKTLLIIVSVL